MNTIKEIAATIARQGILPLFFDKDPNKSLAITRALYNAGVHAIEYTNRGEEALENFRILKKHQLEEMPDLLLGIGTIKDVIQAEKFIDAGVDFIVAPLVNAEVARLASSHNILWCPGCMTPTEIHIAQENCAVLIKLFPANVLGPGFLTAIKELFPNQWFMVTGGVDLTLESISGWFNSGASAVGIGSKLVTQEILKQRIFDQLTLDAQKALLLVKNARQYNELPTS